MEPLFIVGLAKAMSFDIQSCIVAVLMVSLPMSLSAFSVMILLSVPLATPGRCLLNLNTV
jgi:uncharacterized membrane protein YccF (DUF307 family)